VADTNPTYPASLQPLTERGRAAFLEFARTALPWLQARAPQGQVPLTARLITRFDDNTVAWRDELVRERDARAIPLAAKGWAELRRQPGVVDALRALFEEGNLPEYVATDSAGKRLTGRPFEQVVGSVGAFPLDAVRNYLDTHNSFAFDEPRLLASYEELRAARLKTEVEVLITMPLKGFDSEVPTVQLGNGIAIERLTGADKTSLWDSDVITEMFTKEEFAEARFGLRVGARLPKAHSQSRAPAANFRHVVTALRLLAPGLVTAPAMVSEEVPRKGIFGISGVRQLKAAAQVAFVAPQSYRLQAALVPDLLSIYGHLVKLGQGKTGIELPLRRFNQSYDRLAAEDRIIDLAIALESSLLFGIKDELKFRLAVRGATLLRVAQPPADVYQALADMYDIRSLIVHEGKSLTELQKKRAFQTVKHWQYASHIEQYVRLILREYVIRLASGENMKDIVEGLDDELIRHLTLPVPASP